MKNDKQIFVGGYCGSGTRVVQSILKEAGFFIGDPICPVTYDYFPITCVKNNLVLGHGIAEMDMQEVMTKIFGEWWGKYDKWSIKHPFLMVCGNYLKRLFPQSKVILIVRHGIDNILNNHTMEGDIGSILMPSILKEEDLLLRKIRFWNFSHKLAIHDSKFSPNDFHILKLEDLVENPELEIKKILSFLEINANIKEIKKVVKKPKSIGRRKKVTTIIDGEEYIVYYPKKDLNRLYKEGKEMLTYFNYGK